MLANMSCRSFPTMEMVIAPANSRVPMVGNVWMINLRVGNVRMMNLRVGNEGTMMMVQPTM